VSMARRVIVGACDSPGSLRALRYARELADRNDAVLILVHAWTPPGGEMADRRSPSPILRKVWNQAAWQRLWACVDAAWGGFPAEVEVQPVVTRGIPGEVLVEIANRDDDLLVLGAGRRGPLARIGHHGGVARYCLAHAQCPVVAVPPSELVHSARHGLLGYTFRHHGLDAVKALDDADN